MEMSSAQHQAAIAAALLSSKGENPNWKDSKIGSRTSKDTP
jgi:hypothetical protein